MSTLPLLLLGAPLAAALWVAAFRKHPNVREAGAFVGAVLMAGAGVAIARQLVAGQPVELAPFAIVPGLPLQLRADGLGAIFAVMGSGLWVVTSVYSVGYMRGLEEHAQARFSFFFALCLFAVGGLALAGNLVTFILFYELLTITTYPLVIHRESPEAIVAGRRYLAYALGGGLLLLTAIVGTHAVGAPLAFRPGGVFPAGLSRGTLGVLFALYIVGVGVKAGVMPLHSWLPAAMVAPTPVSALLHAVAVVKAGVFGVARVVGWVFGPEVLHDLGASTALAWVAAATILVSSLLALSQDNLKRRLAFSTIGQLSYSVLGLALASPAAFAGGILQMTSHAVMKITLFFCAGAIAVTTHKKYVSELDGVGRQMPITMGCFALASLGLAGFPPLAGFTSKWFLMQGTVEAGQPLFAVVLTVSSVLNVAYLLPVVVRAFFRVSAEHARFGEGDVRIVAPLAITAGLSVLLGVAPESALGLISLVQRTVAEVMR